VPPTGAALQKESMLLGGNYGYEQAIVMEKRTEPNVSYSLVGASRESTIQRELNAISANCFIATMFVTYQETIVVLQCPPN